MKWKGCKLIGYWDDCMTLPFDHTNDLDVEVSRSESEIALSQKWNGRMTWNEKWVLHSWPWCIVWPWWGGQIYRKVTRVNYHVHMLSTYLDFTHCPLGEVKVIQCVIFWQSLLINILVPSCCHQCNISMWTYSEYVTQLNKAAGFVISQCSNLLRAQHNYGLM